MLKLQAGCKGHIAFKAQRCGTGNPDDWGEYNRLNSQFPAPRYSGPRN